MHELHTPKIAILASGSGTTADAYAKAIYERQVSAEIGLVVTNNPDAGILDKVSRWNRDYGFDVRTAIINKQSYPKGAQTRGQTLEESEAITTAIKVEGIGTVALLGYMLIANGSLIEEFGYIPELHRSKYQASMLNTHPGPLPETEDTYGIHTSQKVIDLGLPTSKHTVHVVASGVDKGPIVVAHEVPVLEDDSAEALNQRTQIVEKATIAYAIDKFIREQREYRSLMAQ
jgi:phosphoribosylglycinamide formyltransferase 1